MKFISIIALLASPLAINATRIAWNSVYDDVTQSLSTVACSNGPNGLLAKYATFKDLPTFPHIGASDAIAAWGSPNCGTCWNVTYQGVTVTVTAIDLATNGFVLSKDSVNALTNNQAEFFGAVDGTSVQVDKSFCGL